MAKAKTLDKQRSLKQARYRSFRLSKPIKHPAPSLVRARTVARESVALLWRHKRPLLFIIVVYLFLYVVFARGFNSSGLSDLRDTFLESESSTAPLTASVGLFAYLLGSAATAQTEAASLYQLILTIVASLAMIWLIRQAHAGKTKRYSFKEAYYKGNAQIIPFVLVLVVIGIQLLPAIIGLSIYQQVVSFELITSSTESFVWITLLMMTLFVSFYMIASSVFALYIVTLPDMKPVQALRSARDLVQFRRFEVMRRILFLPLLLLLVGLLVFGPLALLATTAAEYLFLLYGAVALAMTHSYMYHLYRRLL